MKVSPLTSVGAKLFYYMTALVVFTIAGNSLQFSKTFLEHQQSQIKDSIVSEAEDAKNGFSQSIETWKSQIAVALPSLRGVGEKRSTFLIQNFTDSNQEFISFEILETPSKRSTKFKSLGKGFTSNTKDRRWSGKDPKALKRKISSAVKKFLKKEVPKASNHKKIIIDTIAKKTRLPIMVTAARFSITGSDKVVWGVLTTWQSGLIKALPKSRFVTSKVVDKNGRVFTSHDENEMINGRLSRSKITIKALRARTPAGFQDEYVQSGRRTLGGFARISDYGLTVIIEQDAEKAYEILQRSLIATGLWAILFVLLAVMFSYWGATGITKGLRAVTHATTKIASGEFGYRVQSKNNDEVGVLSHSINQMSSKIVSLMQSQVEKARFEKELETAKMVQSTFFPKQDILSKHLKITGFYQPASECGGDLWGHYNISDGVDFVYIADATGHGAPAALVTAIAYTTTKTLSDVVKNSKAASEPPSAILERLNRIIYEAVEGSICMTFFGAIIDTNRGTLTFSNAGHNLPILLPNKAGDDRAKRVSKYIKKITDIPPISLMQSGAPLGLEPNSKFSDSVIELRHGDKIFFFTDGLIECQAPDDRVWGRKTLLEYVMRNVEQPASELKNEVLSQAFSFFENRPLDDDITVVVAELDCAWEKSEYTPDKQTSVPPPLPRPDQMQSTDSKSKEAAPPLIPAIKTAESTPVEIEVEAHPPSLELDLNIQLDATSNLEGVPVVKNLPEDASTEITSDTTKPHDKTELKVERKKKKERIKLPSAG